MISVMTIILLLALVTALVVALERHHRRTWGPRASHGADSSIAFTDLDHDFERVHHDVVALR